MRQNALAFVLLAMAAWGAEGVPQDEYQTRRDRVREAFRSGVTILIGATVGEHGDLRSPFFQEANFYYLSGWTEPGAILAITPDSDILFIPGRNPERERWTGFAVDPSSEEAPRKSGFANVRPAERFEAVLPEIVRDTGKVYTLLDQPYAEKLRTLLPLREFGDAAAEIARLRMTKSVAEVDLIRRATDITVDAHRAAWSRMRPGLREYQLAATMANVYMEAGCRRPAYAPIVGSGPNSVILHYNRNSRRFDSGEVVLMDVGAECDYYATDVTRTVPAGGEFTERQRELYEIVLGAQRAVLAAVKPGMTLARHGPDSLYRIACDFFNEHKDSEGNGLCRYFTHGIGHHVGLDVHDPYDKSRPLAPGMVITVEPGLYLPEESIGIRIEDIVLVTGEGAEVLSLGLPKEPAAIERFVKSSRSGELSRSSPGRGGP